MTNFYFKHLLWITILFPFFFFSCVPPIEQEIKEVKIDLSDPVIQKIIDYKDQSYLPGLYKYLKSQNAAYRYQSAIAFASIQDKTSIDSLYPLLNDIASPVRVAAAYSLGQIGDKAAEPYLIQAFKREDTIADIPKTRRAILEAIGKCGSEQSMNYLAQVEFPSKDTLHCEGQALGLYYFTLRGIDSKTSTKKAIDIVKDKSISDKARLYAAHYLMRGKYEQDSTFARDISIALALNEDPDLKMALASALGKTGSKEHLPQLNQMLKSNIDYRIKINIINSFQNFDYTDIQASIFELLDDSTDIKIVRQAANFMLENGQKNDARVFYRKAKAQQDIPTKISLFKAVSRHAPIYMSEIRNAVNYNLKRIWRDTSHSDYIRSEALKGLAEQPWNFRYITHEAFNDSNFIFSTKCMEAIQMIAERPDFDQYFGPSKKSVKKEIAATLAEAINTGDAATKAIAADLISDPNLKFKDFYDNSGFLYVAKRKLELPKETETLITINKAIAHFDNKEYKANSPKYNHPIDWKKLEGKTDGKLTAEINTSKGKITFELKPKMAPASVISFLDLVEKGFYNGKTFHRVVPNFVVQGGCPRGDGYGSLDYSLRSEFNFNYYDEQGYVGLASAGKDTEGVQWFITHSPTPHLDGRYTIFAKVIEGISTVHKLEIGDKINSININFVQTKKLKE